MEDWRKIFKKFEDEYFRAYSFTECSGTVTIEDLYQAFKERLKDELTTVHGDEMNPYC